MASTSLSPDGEFSQRPEQRRNINLSVVLRQQGELGGESRPDHRRFKLHGHYHGNSRCPPGRATAEDYHLHGCHFLGTHPHDVPFLVLLQNVPAGIHYAARQALSGHHQGQDALLQQQSLGTDPEPILHRHWIHRCSIASCNDGLPSGE